MKKILPLLSLIATAVFLHGCASTSIAKRIQEKPAVFTTLTAEQKQAIEDGLIAVGFNTDMVYLALGEPSVVETKTTSDGPVTKLTYKRYYPSTTFIHLLKESGKMTGSRMITQVPSDSMIPPIGSGESSGARAAAGLNPSGSAEMGQPSYGIGFAPYYTLHVVLYQGQVMDIAIAE